MKQSTVARPRCRICGDQMLPSDEQDHFTIEGVTEYVCVNAECLEFGISKPVKGSRR